MRSEAKTRELQGIPISGIPLIEPGADLVSLICEITQDKGPALRDGDVIDCVVEERDQTSDTNNRQWLDGEGAEYHSSQCGGEQPLIDTEVALRVPQHIQLEGHGWEKVDKEYTDGAGKSSIVETVDDVAPVVG